jgi:putative endonuclease
MITANAPVPYLNPAFDPNPPKPNPDPSPPPQPTTPTRKKPKPGTSTKEASTHVETPRSNPAHDLGRRGEDLVAKYIQTRGLTLLCRNWRCREGEIDIIATDGDMLVVCEVKTRTTNEFGTPADAMSQKKIRCVRAATNRWLREFQVPYVAIRYDLAELWWPTTGKPHLQYRRDAF